MSDSPIKDLVENNPSVMEFFEGQNLAVPAGTPVDDDVPTEPVPEKAEEPPRDELAPRSPMEIYEAEIAEFGLTLDDAARIVDSLIHQQTYTEAVRVTRRLSVQFRTRTPRQVSQMYATLNQESPNIQGMAVSIIAKYNLVYSLVKYGDKVLDPSSEAGFRQALDFVDRLPGPLYNLLLQKLTAFDDKLQAVMKEEAIANF